MCNEKTIPLGFTEDNVPVGTHMCLIFTKEEERVNSLLKFLISGIENKEQVACFTDEISEETIKDYFTTNNISYDEIVTDKRFTFAHANEIYLQDGEFKPESMLELLSNYYTNSIKSGFHASRVIGEMTADVERVPGGDRLLEYESKVSILVRDKPVTAFCQYDANKFDGATIMEIIKVHPKMLVDGSVIQNPFYIQPEEYLSNL